MIEKSAKVESVAIKLGKTIKLCRDRQQLHQKELAEKAGISESYLSLIEKGKRTPNLDVLDSIAKALNIPLNMLIFLASDKSELAKLDQSLAEKLSLIAWNIIEANDADTALQR